ncbi:phospho-N-acetylmuramoyl-pentapeptide-transferase [Macrococcoides caseolyticum]|uniref:Phospho-N-acetylmuramoyl-pentapeptide-transferase n=1 Tax=Macrococcoides caseolyticum TaxID=69966 RepID=A0A855GPU3_9STAP|nr:phospho-N-acetylmuramoyl-pentapeptide-transferase [Macrococcus caseolyticus]ARQ04199.1 Phospho-N-acetylmuramoyl-pentapeptide-transferase [Macrococcus caseolyticus]PKE07963.1 phospho-N-acetylmuramoyl-pentapeptide-transferase [Macrococcus caseolyticus]PKE24961.1 phospho-N-acetylmuramoyl-pentapeptide-transferase [Macrococcus caseolyticus]PKE26316.1 phospho-N-acetylmuramoyl-pentapeptide-transferase [Macrococcus caseolyticus]PKE50437.1 phospho-N-acetylmuramoyl-pentapeptide-transferase [Macrococc
MNEIYFGVIAFILTAILVPLFIPLLKRMKFGQSIREEGPKSHMVKSGTPTMGGLTFLISTVLLSAIACFFVEDNGPLILLILVTVGFGLIGFVDDYIIVVKKNNQGLTSKQKFLFQIIIAILFYVVSNVLGLLSLSNEINIPFTDIGIPLSIFYVIFIIFWQVGFSNAVNLTDGLDGLATGLSIIAFSCYFYLAMVQGATAMAYFSAILIGSLCGFLLYNKNKAKLFMGDTGSLALGGVIATVSIMLNQELTLIFIGFVYVVETLSVMMQVTSFKLTGKRIFKMSPLHHHFEMVGWSEWKIVTVFWIVGILTGLIGIYLGVN